MKAARASASSLACDAFRRASAASTAACDSRTRASVNASILALRVVELLSDLGGRGRGIPDQDLVVIARRDDGTPVGRERDAGQSPDGRLIAFTGGCKTPAF